MKNISEFEIYDPKQEIAIKTIKDNVGKWFVFCGSPGTGKTEIAKLVAKDMMSKGAKKAMYVRAFNLFLEIKTNFLNALEIISEYGSQDVLIIDEIEKFWKSKDGENERNVLFEIIQRLYEEDKCLILISNYKWAELQREGIMTDYIVDRFFEKGKYVLFDWESYRKRKKEEHK